MEIKILNEKSILEQETEEYDFIFDKPINVRVEVDHSIDLETCPVDMLKPIMDRIESMSWFDDYDDFQFKIEYVKVEEVVSNKDEQIMHYYFQAFITGTSR